VLRAGAQFGASWSALPWRAASSMSQRSLVGGGSPRSSASWACDCREMGSHPVKVAILMAMTVGEQMPLAEVKNRLSEVVDRLEREHGRVVITKHGHPAAVVISVEDLESLEETLDVMGSEALLADIREALAELATADVPVLSKDDALRMITGR
jgi:antitoxin YefM